MRGKRLFTLRVNLAIFTVTLLVSSTWAGAQETVLHSFTNNGEDGFYPSTSLIFDTAGNLYGTTHMGGEGGGPSCSVGCGTVFQFAPGAGGTWTETVLHSFSDNGKDGYYPYASLIFDAAGNLYGTTGEGGAHDFGTVFELTPTADGGWTEKILHSFNQNGKDGYEPRASVTFDTKGNLYGTTYGGGAHNSGAVFELVPKAGGGWTEKILRSFNDKGEGGYWLNAGLILDAAGNLYGTTFWGGNSRCGREGCGTVFELIPKGSGSWTEKVLHRFNGAEGVRPSSGLIFDASGNLYGTTQLGGGAHNSGTVFELLPKAGGGWTEKILHRFHKDPDGAVPVGGLIFDSAGNLYGTTASGGAYYNGGTVFELTPTAGGSWAEEILYSFDRNGGSGFSPQASLILDASGNLYGTTVNGGGGTGCDFGCGTVFEITP
jgi:uncharacterized repeat protein (TIGR03803 family)